MTATHLTAGMTINDCWDFMFSEDAAGRSHSATYLEARGRCDDEVRATADEGWRIDQKHDAGSWRTS